MAYGRRHWSNYSRLGSASGTSTPCSRSLPKSRHRSSTAPQEPAAVVISPSVPWIVPPRTPVRPHPVPEVPRRTVPNHIAQPRYAQTGDTVSQQNRYGDPTIPIYKDDKEFLDRMRHAGQIAATVLREAARFCQTLGPPKTTLDVDALVHYRLLECGAYPSPLNYAGFPRSVCTSVNEVICHGIPDARHLQYGDLVAIDVSCYVGGVHGDNCATVLVGDHDDHDFAQPRRHFRTAACHEHFVRARRLRDATREAVAAAVALVQPDRPVSDLGRACQRVADRYGYRSVAKYRGHGIGTEFHTPPYIRHTDPDNDDDDPPVLLQNGMIFTIEPMFCEGAADCYEWESDHWTVATRDGGWAAQFEHAVLVTEQGAEILTLPLDD
jgi:methionyl aminopeptidase